MKKTKQKRKVLYSFCLVLLILTATSMASLSVDASADPAVVSPALYILAEENSMAMAGLRGGQIRLDRDDFARAMNLSKVNEITITQIPPVTDGELRVGNTVLTGAQTVSGANLDLLSYTASGADISGSSFRFTVGSSPLEITCRLYLLDQVNSAPTLSMVPETLLNVSTHRNITLYGSLPCYDPDGDQTVIEIVSYPKSGILALTDRTRGEYTFTPGTGYSGKDSFTYVARDIYGNYSAAATVSLSVVKPSTSVVYADLTGSPAHNAALTMTEEGIMSGTQVGNYTYFYPNQAVSRGEFVVMAMHAMGIEEVTVSSQTVFADEGDMPEQMKGYIATAYRLGYISGEKREDGTICFSPNRAISRAEAAVILGRMLDAATPTVTPTFSDSEEIPAWAAPSLYSLNAMGVMNATGGEISPMDPLTRADTACILSAVLQLQEIES